MEWEDLGQSILGQTHISLDSWLPVYQAELNKESSDDVFVKGIRSTLNKLTVADSVPKKGGF